jgi:hypothetical protein
MDIKKIKELAQNHSSEELNKFADQFEQTGVAPVVTSEDPGDQMSDYLQAAEVRAYMETNQCDINQAVREFSKRVRGVLS